MAQGAKEKSGRALRSEIANKLLLLSEQVTDPEIRDVLEFMERSVLSAPAGPTDHPRYQEMICLLKDAPGILARGNRQQGLNYVERIQEGISNWQRAAGNIGGVLMGWKERFSKDAKAKKKEDLLIEKLERSVFDLQQKQLKLQANIEKAERERTAILEKASKEAPGSNVYLIAKGRYDMLSAQIQNAVFLFTATGKALGTNSNYLATLQNKRDTQELGAFMPISLEAMEEDLENCNTQIEGIVDKLNEGAEISQFAAEGRAEAYSSLIGNTEKSDFDDSVSQLRESQSILAELAATNDPAAKEPESGKVAQGDPAGGAPENNGLNPKEVEP